VHLVGVHGLEKDPVPIRSNTFISLAA
jgi:hypothetical protein